MKVFNIGDEVICTDREDDNWYQIGDKYIISGEGFEDDDQDWVYNIEGQHKGVWIVANHFELYKSKEGFYFHPEEHVSIAEGSKEAVDEALGISQYTGGSSDYYKVTVKNPTTLPKPYEAECNDIIEALDMTFAEGNAFKAIWRKAKARQGVKKKGYDNGVYDSEKIVFFGERMLVQAQEIEK